MRKGTRKIMEKTAYSYVRFSTQAQGKNRKTGELKHSYKRQLSAAQEWCRQNDVSLSKKVFPDLGVSAFKGLNKTKGKLSAFIKLVEDGKVEKGSILIIESLDRLSRETVLTAFSLFTRLINELEIEIVTLNPQYHFSKRTNDAHTLMFAIATMSRAHEESSMKSYRLKKTYEEKRRNIHLKPLTSRCPSWLQLNKKNGKSEWVIIEKAAAVVKTIFQMSNGGDGVTKIAKHLNNMKTKAFRGGIWEKSSVLKVLRSNSVYGEFTPHTLKGENKERVPAGPPIPNYYPSIISKELFDSVQNKLGKRKNQKGRVGKGITNLFRGLLFWENTNQKMRLTNKGSGSTMYCRDQLLGDSPSKPTGFIYEAFEASFLALIDQINSITDSDSNKEKALTDELNQARMKVASIKETLTKTYKILRESGDKNIPPEHFAELYKMLEEAQSIRDKKQVELDSYRLESSDQTKTLINQMRNATGEEKILLRTRLREEIAEIVKRIDISIKSFKSDRTLTAIIHLNSGNSKTIVIIRTVFYSGGGNKNPLPKSVFLARSDDKVLFFKNTNQLLNSKLKPNSMTTYGRKQTKGGIEAISITDDQLKALEESEKTGSRDLKDIIEQLNLPEKQIIKINKNRSQKAQLITKGSGIDKNQKLLNKPLN